MDKFLQYDFNTTVIQANQDFPVDPRCNGLTFWNQGATACLVRGIPIPAGVATSIGGNYGEVFQSRIPVSFTGGVGVLVIIQKFYIGFTEIRIPGK